MTSTHARRPAPGGATHARTGRGGAAPRRAQTGATVAATTETPTAAVNTCDSAPTTGRDPTTPGALGALLARVAERLFLDGGRGDAAVLFAYVDAARRPSPDWYTLTTLGQEVARRAARRHDPAAALAWLALATELLGTATALRAREARP